MVGQAPQRRLSELLSQVPRSSLPDSSDATLAVDEDLLVSGARACPQPALDTLPPPPPPGSDRRRTPGAARPARSAAYAGAALPRSPRPARCTQPLPQVPRLVARIAELEERLYADAGGVGWGDAAAEGGLLDKFGGLLKKAQQGLDAGISYV